MDGQLSFATLDYAGKKKRTKRDVFLAEMAATVPWSVLEAVIAPHYPQQGPQGVPGPFPFISVDAEPSRPTARCDPATCPPEVLLGFLRPRHSSLPFHGSDFG